MVVSVHPKLLGLSILPDVHWVPRGASALLGMISRYMYVVPSQILLDSVCLDLFLIRE